MSYTSNGRYEPPDHDAPVAPGPDCAHFATLLPLYDEHALDADDERATHAHLMGCRWCQAQRASYAVVDVALRRFVGALMAEAPLFTEEEIMRQADDITLRTRRASEETAPAASAPSSARSVGDLPLPTRYVPPTPSPRRNSRRRFLSGLGALAAAALIVALAVAIFAPRILQRQGPVTGAQPTTTSSLADMTLYTQRIGGRAYAFRASDGKIENTFIPPSFNGFVSQTIAQGVMYELDTADATASHSFLSATRFSDGKQLWRRQIETIETPTIIAQDGVIYMDTSFPGTTSIDYNPASIQAVYAYRASDGALLWRQTLPNALISPPVVSGGVFYGVESDLTGADGGTQLVALRASDGAKLWTTPVSTQGDAPVAAWGTVADGSVYWHFALLNNSSQATPNDNKEKDPVVLIAARTSDGGLRWQILLGNDMYIGSGPFAPVVANGIVYDRIASWGGSASNAYHLQLFALRETDGTQVWKFEEDNSSSGLSANIFEPAVVNGVLYVTEDDGSLIAMQANTGVRLWRFNTTGVDDFSTGQINTPIFADGVLFLTTGLYIVAVRAGDGLELWREYAQAPDTMSISNTSA